jgi:hypothetical protein
MKNKTILSFLAILPLIFLGGCATKRMVVHVPVTPGMSEKEIKAADKAAVQKSKQEEAVANFWSNQDLWKSQLALSCPLDDIDRTQYKNVVIYLELAHQYRAWRGTGVMGVLYNRYVMVHRAKNPYTNMVLDITNGGQPVVKSMCPGGSITLVQSMPAFPGGGVPTGLFTFGNGGYNSLRVTWTAEGIVDGRLAYGDSSPGTLYQGWYNTEAVAMRPTWIMDLNRVDKQF